MNFTELLHPACARLSPSDLVARAPRQMFPSAAPHESIPMETYTAAKEHILSLLPANTLPSVGIVCGSGLGKLYQLLDESISVGYDSIPGFVRSTVAGHDGKLVFGKLGQQYVVCMVGRFHPYEGWSMAQVTFPMRVMALLGIKLLIVTNAAGGLDPTFNVGDMMVFEDHIALPMIAGNNPLVGPNLAEFGPRFPPTSDAYPRAYRAHAFRTAAKLGLLDRTHSGVYCFVSGPQYETRAECRLLRSIGGGAVGMSTVPECVIARHAGVAVLGISLITNKVVGRREDDVKAEVVRELAGEVKEEEVVDEKASHEEVLKASTDFAANVLSLVKTVVEELHTVPEFNAAK
ncbi:inosine guanosine and xanthosine phosphorylase [Allomyces macrogynus ATCC 38327]|uniref:purine-nucleoside phosphorylase n=2 Tax=Allomyces macrogynus (strain ATCC 38327) TaxID=578462 RepID=A0A0L0T805_ALLM3|nr:inosine guanosine and xanthosine phosphorylase [Allomyces macrogynus ATCC 38327]|eukprot:KNE70882.1 inosine guanosine and xanthosine phosphorylase [Allomyces macrogynus ATCC 38327]